MVEDTDNVPCPSQASIVFLILYILEVNAAMTLTCFLHHYMFINLIGDLHRGLRCSVLE